MSNSASVWPVMDIARLMKVASKTLIKFVSEFVLI